MAKTVLANSKNPWFRRRGYPHFDLPISFRGAKKIVSDPDQVAKRSFLPFIEFTIESVKFKSPDGSSKPKRVPKTRPIAYASHIDCHIYSYYSFQLSRLYEERIRALGLTPNILAFRTLGKSNIEFARDAFEDIRRMGACAVLALDVRGFFDNLNHSILKMSWASVLGIDPLPDDHYAVFKSLTKYAKVNRNELYRILGISLNNHKSAPERLCTIEEFRSIVRPSGLIKQHPDTKGIPQGSPISALLSNLYMLNFDVALSTFVKSCGGTYLRYCDDILLIVPPEKKIEAEALAISEIGKIHLEINSDKTDRIDFSITSKGLNASKPLQYLGFLFDGKRVLLRSASLARYSERMRRAVRLAKATMEKCNKARLLRGVPPKVLFTRKLWRKHSHIGRQNFITYGLESAATMQSTAIKKQLRGLMSRLKHEIDLPSKK